MIIMTSKNYHAKINEAFKKGYDIGYDKGKYDGLLSKVTPNEIRKMLGLAPIMKEQS